MANMLSLQRFCRLTLGIFLLVCNSLAFANENETKASELSKLELAKKDADEFQNLASQTKPSVVVVESVDRTGREGGRGTGFVVSSDGIIATNFHVIGEHRDFSIRFSNGESYRPKSIIGIDRSRDLALIKIDAEDLPVLELGDSDKLVPGEAILSLGNPLGYTHSVSRGVVAALRELEFGDGRPMVQVAIPIEPGSSGSPALDLEGKVVAILSIKSGGAIGFAVPVNALKDLLAEKTKPIPMKKWLTIGALDELEWQPVMNGSWKQRAGTITASGLGNGFGGRMVCLNQRIDTHLPYELEVEVRLEDESGAAGLVFHSTDEDSHYGFYPSNGSLRLTRFDGASVYDWTILKTVDHSAYQLGEWNRLKVRLEENGRIVCTVNEQVVIDETDFSLRHGQVGLCKFREPTAHFRGFRLAKRFSPKEINSKFRNRIKKLTQPLTKRKAFTNEVDALVKLGEQTPQALRDLAQDLENQAKEAKRLADEVRERLVIQDLANSLSYNNDQSVDLLRASLLVARLENEHFDLDNYLKKADLLAQKIEKFFPEEATGEERLKILVTQLFEEMGFHGSTLDYHHRSNSFINEVMDDREGLPITLSILLIELAQRLDLPVSGIGLPGHFMAIYREDSNSLDEKNPRPAKEFLIDAFGGKIVSRKEASEIIGLPLDDEDFHPIPKKDIITRVLRNLINSADQERDREARLRYVNALVAVDPADRYNRTMRALIHYGEERFSDALVDLEYLISEFPQAPEVAPLLEIRNRLIEQGKSNNR